MPPLDLTGYAFVDNNARSVLTRSLEIDKFGFRLCFAQTDSRPLINDYFGGSIAYRDMIRRVGQFLGTDDEDEYLLRRTGRLLSEYMRLLWDTAKIQTLLVEEPANGDMFSIPRLAEASQRNVFSCLLIERVIESCMEESATLSELLDGVQARLFVDRAPSVMALSTEMILRSCAPDSSVTKTAASSDFDKVKKKFAKGEKRISAGRLYEYLLEQILELAACHTIPVQVHFGCANGRPSQTSNSPAALLPVLANKNLAHTPLVLMNCYPHVRQAALLASQFPNIFVELSTVMLTASSNGSRLVHELIAGAPVGKILAGTGGSSCPESHWYGALMWKESLAHCLRELIGQSFINRAQADSHAQDILSRNAIRLYKFV